MHGLSKRRERARAAQSGTDPTRTHTVLLLDHCLFHVAQTAPFRCRKHWRGAVWFLNSTSRHSYRTNFSTRLQTDLENFCFVYSGIRMFWVKHASLCFEGAWLCFAAAIKTRPLQHDEAMYLQNCIFKLFMYLFKLNLYCMYFTLGYPQSSFCHSSRNCKQV